MRLAKEMSPYNKGLGEWYRYYDTQAEPYIRLQKLPVLRTTPAGVWLYYLGEEKFVLNGTGKRWAYPTIELAQNSFRIRKQKQLGYVRHYFERLELINKALKDGTAFTDMMQPPKGQEYGWFDLDGVFG